MTAEAQSGGGTDLARFLSQKLRQKNTYVVALVVGTAINAYGHLLVPWMRGHGDPFTHFVEEFRTFPVLVIISMVITLQLLGHEIAGKVDIVQSLGDIPSINCFPARLNQAFLTVLMNAIQAVEVTGRVWLTTSTTDEVVEIEVRDDGRGISPEHLTRVFDAGFTTKGVGVGTGLGLSICKQTIEDHGGTIDITSQLGEGTTVTIRLPLSGVAAPPSQRPVT